MPPPPVMGPTAEELDEQRLQVCGTEECLQLWCVKVTRLEVCGAEERYSCICFFGAAFAGVWG